MRSDNSKTLILQCKAQLKILVVTAEVDDVILPKWPFVQNKDLCKKTANAQLHCMCIPNMMKKFDHRKIYSLYQSHLAREQAEFRVTPT